MAIALFRPDNIETGLQGYWKLNGDATDSSVNGNDLTPSGSPSYVAQDYWNTDEQSVDFEASSSQYMSITDAAQTGLDITGSYSMSVFIKIEALGTIDIMGKRDWPQHYVLRADSGHFSVYHDNVNLIEVTNVFSAGKWYHVGLTYDTDNNILIAYVDGNIVGSATVSDDPDDHSGPFMLGSTTGTADYFDGLMKDAAIWNTVLTPQQIKSLALGIDLATYAYRPDNVSTAPTAWWKLNEVSGTRADSSGNGHTLTDNNTVLAGGGLADAIGADFESANSEYFSIADHADWDCSGGIWSASLWYKMESLTNVHTLLSQSTDGTHYWQLQISNTGNQIQLQVNDGGLVINQKSGSALSTGTWHHIGITQNGNDFIIYLDGVENFTFSDADRFANYTQDFWIGKSTAGEYMDGVASDIAFWKGYVVTADEMASLACGLPIQQSGIVSYWKLDEESGTRVDSLGDNDLTDNNTVLYGTGKVSNAADFELANTEYLSLANVATIDIVRDLTVLGWIKPETDGAAQTILDKDSANDGYGIIVGADDKIDFLVNNDTDTTTSSIAAGTWSHFAGVYDGATKAIWFNSAKEGNGAYTSNPADTTAALNVGATITPANYFDGLVDELVLATRWFRDEEIKMAYNKGLNAKEITSSETETPPAGGESGAFLAIL